MSTLAGPLPLELEHEASVPERLAVRALGSRAGETAWATPALAGVMALAGILYLWDLTVSGFANAYYSAAAQAASQSWTAFFFGSVDAGSFITVDKPPLATMLMGLSVRLFGLSSASILLPEALLGVATVGLLFLVVRRSFGLVAGLIAALVMALTPAAVLMFRYDNPDALLTFLLVAAAGAFLRALEDGRRRWLVAAAVLIGLAFDTKFLQAYLVLPGFALTYLIVAAGSWRRRIVDLLLFGVTTFLASAWWVAIVELTPAGLRPFIGGSTTNSAVELLLGYDGLARILGIFGLDPRGGSDGGGPGGAGGFGGSPGLLRMFNDQFAGQIGWLLPLALVGLVAGLWLTRHRGRTDPRRAAYLLWGGWLVVHVGVFSFMSGIVHSYYVVALAPAIGALVGAGVVELWALRQRHRFGGLPLGVGIVGTGALAAALLGRTPDFAPGLAAGILGLAVAAGLIVALPAFAVSRRLSLAAVSVGIAAMLLAPGAYALDTTGTAYSGGDPSAGPAMAGSDRGGAAGGPGIGSGFPSGPGSTGTFPGGGSFPDGQGLPSAGTAPGGGGPGGTLDQATIDYLLANRGGATWLVAVNSANRAAPIQLATGVPVMAMGGFTGSDPAPTLDQLKSYIASGQLRFVLVDGGGASAPGGVSSGVGTTRDAWVTATCTAVHADSGGGVLGGGLYDCAGTVAASGS